MLMHTYGLWYIQLKSIENHEFWWKRSWSRTWQFVDLLNNYQATQAKRQELSIASCTDVVVLYTWQDHEDCEELILLETTVVKTQSY